MTKSGIKRKRPRKLTIRQEKFALEYAASGNGAAAARRAGYSPTCDADIACRLLKNLLVRRIIDQIRTERQEAARCHAKVDGRLATTDMAVSVAEFLTIDTTGILRFKCVGELTSHQIQALERVQLSAAGTTEGIVLRQPIAAVQELISLSAIGNSSRDQDTQL